ncbi:Putative mRNA interferase MazF9 [endosymbiont DhMRE of Dentiscutata heterogama]|uniref:type II toxin-antitoxin system PemK/MazF family toxin n=1 Tax=endosymbiont DhMRE of Dentiscutata heterogama TaxID=1609546 RepID=UPI000629D266|nr:type II toxin-antitoxin system PemK/MazF family toxin [endosymbiont DhMRE of Dentiscutata heterogama]CFW92767.1 Putative mRNA interferase MazF9 [endosymbiont DhMRE of Dentiscutata heterogama]
MTPTNEKMPVENRIIKRGEVYYANLDDAIGHEQKNDKDSERRLAVVVSNNKQNEQNKVVVIVPLSSKVHNLKPSFQAPTLFQGKPGKAKCEQVRAVDVERLLGTKQGNLTENEMENIDKKLLIVLDLAKYLGRTSESKTKRHYSF